MSSENLADDNTSKRCRVIDYVGEISFKTLDTGEAAIDVCYVKPNRGSMTETFVLKGNAYLMNDDGKTIQSFAKDSYK